MSDHDIYVYGTLRGRALVGLSAKYNSDDYDDDNDVTKEKKASMQHTKIFASRFDAELVCIGSYFTTID